MTTLRRITSRLFAVALLLSGCAGAGDALPYMRGGTALRALNETGAGKIKHVVFIIQENRSFDNMFEGYPGADTVSSGKNEKGQTIELQPASLSQQYIIDHSAQAMFAACDGTGKLPGTDCRMDGFDKEEGYGGPHHREYVYVPQSESKPYWDMAREWVLADKTFQSQLDESFVAHQYAIAAQAADTVNLPTGAWACGGGRTDTIHTITKERLTDGPKTEPCFDYETLGDELDKAKLSWRFYASTYGSQSSGQGASWSSFQSVKHIRYGPDWKNVISPNWKFITDVRAGQLANFTWITPVCDDSDHVACLNGGYGPSWVADLVDTIGNSKFWNSTAIFVIWDDWGGLYDHVPPPYAGRDGLGFRVPLIVLSPYTPRGAVTHVQYETSSVLRFMEDNFGLAPLAQSDARANDPALDPNLFDFNAPPRRFQTIRGARPSTYWTSIERGSGIRPAPQGDFGD
jgi:phospholipase C